MAILKKKRWKIVLALLLLLAISPLLLRQILLISPPVIDDDSALAMECIQLEENLYTCNDSWLRKNRYGLWEMYLSGNPFELGVKNGKLTKDLAAYQEQAFVERIKEMIPSEGYLNFLRYLIAFFNKNMDKDVPVEYQKEIYGVSLMASDDYDFISPKYQRILNYHGAHDIGHAIQNFNLVFCSAFALWGDQSEDSTLIIGRNFDFYSGDNFAKNKIVAFYNPEQGHPFMMITWGGMTGVVSGMNTQGLTISLNAAKSAIPKKAALPVSLLARKILQYATNIEEAYQIAQEHQTFVSESFLIGSAKDGRAVVIEKSIDTIGMYDPNNERLVLTNHFQSNTFKNSKLNLQNIHEGASMYRYQRIEELLDSTSKHNAETVVKILRDRKGKAGADIGLGNEKTINQLIAHHSVIFKPKQLQVWVSTSPFQLGKFVKYDLKSIFSDSIDFNQEIDEVTMELSEDPFLYSHQFNDFQKYWELTKTILSPTAQFTNEQLSDYCALNPQFFYPYQVSGNYLDAKGDADNAQNYYEIALQKVLPRKVDSTHLTELLQKIIQ